MRQYKKIWAILTLLCFTLTFLPAAAFAALDVENSTVYTIDDNPSVQVGETVNFAFDFDGATTNSVYVWFIKESSNEPSISADVVSGIPTNIPGVYQLTGNINSGDEFKVSFANTGKYTIAASTKDPYIAGKTVVECIRNADYKILPNDSNKKTITIENDTDSKLYTMQLVDNAGLPFGINIGDTLGNKGETTIGAGMYFATGDEGPGITGVTNFLAANGVASGDITFKLLDDHTKAVKGATIKLSTSNTNCKVNKDKIVTDQLGQFSFNITLLEEAPHTDGFTVFIEAGDYESKVKITASSTGAYDLSISKSPQAPISTSDTEKGANLSDYIWIKIDDVNGNTVMPYNVQPGGNYEEPAFAAYKTDMSGDVVTSINGYDKSANGYVSVVSKPSGSKLEDENCWLRPVGWDAAFQSTLYFDKDLIAGDYTIKITLSSGKYKTISFKVAEMGTPVKLTITPKGQVTELGGSTSASFSLVDANGVTAKAIRKGTDVAVSGYGVASTKIDDNTVKIYTKDDDKYLGSEIKIVATNDRYNLVGESTLNITSGKAGIVWMTQTAPINTPTDLTYIMMDQGKMMSTTIGQAASATPQPGDYKIAAGQTGFVVVAKPEGATVNFDARAAGGAISSILGDCYAVGRVESNKPGVVTLKMSIGVQIYTSEGTWVTRYYEGTQNILFTDGKAGKNVIMSIGSNEAVINGGKTALDASPIIKDNRTFVPFRALAEAFGAEVAYDEATKAVTAELNGVKVVMTIGSTTYTVDGKEKTADVAPYVSNGRTMVPVRFAAEAFGSKVTPTYDDKGATADILFTL